MTVYNASNIAETESVAAEIAKKLENGGFLALYGGMGAGKTTFVRGLVKALCPECLDLVHSPTFAIVNEYRGEKISIFHFDLYRLTDEDDLYSTGFYDYIEQGALVITEWTELFEDSVPEGAIKLKIETVSETERRFTLC
ncbi:MAG: tRNA (adenosine(37)-N6)-threonylcarbamoyltransferase complex ATPase subunit type 1 TsaE [Clostridia bacterium]|jgi:tRNA threonylcarbamoyladenosine biosynthesis protein TsaE|nr:tRNA (adenosine(37)-N6)-threonylcarbamoyltransferase complex ATPase subunit type 1 TsaE [Clostridia bacterium]MBO5915149.1 tRNA (adenosine(37)-N6)-threonylcarbamoyltransferase complex ATPase subunit type 1 TsaE [Clostridia bacterium]